MKKYVGCKEKNSIFALAKGSLAQLVQSTCLTSKGSLVRAQQFPQNPMCHTRCVGFFLSFAIPVEIISVFCYVPLFVYIPLICIIVLKKHPEA